MLFPIDRSWNPNQGGAVLAVGLVILLVSAVIGVAFMQTVALEEKMAGNYRDLNLAFQAGEAALRDAEADIDSRSRFVGLTGFNANCTNGLCDAQTNGLRDVWSETATKNNGVDLGTYTSTGSLDLVVCQPEYWIEGFKVRPPGSASWKVRYRITSSSCGGTNSARVLVQSVYAP